MQGKERLAVMSAGVQCGQDQCCAVSDSDVLGASLGCGYGSPRTRAILPPSGLRLRARAMRRAS